MSIEDRITVYDSNCRLCRMAIVAMRRGKWIDGEKAEAYADLSPDKLAKVDLERFRSDIASIDMNGGATLYGAECVLYAMGYRFPFLRKLKKGSFLFSIIEFFYKNLAWNRYIIMRPVSTLTCECEPPLKKFYRLTLFTLCLIKAFILSSLLGLAIGKHFSVSSMEVVKVTLLTVGSGWFLQLLISRIVLGIEKFYDYMGHIGIIMAWGVAVLIPGIAFFWLPDNFFYPVMGLNILCSNILMFRMHYRRAASIGLSYRWTILWFLCLQCGAAFWLIAWFKGFI